MSMSRKHYVMIAEVIERLQRITNKINDAIQEGKDMKADGYVYENFELKQKEVK